MTRIHPHIRTVKDILLNTEYGIDLYQREYEWERRNIEELMEDFESSFWSAHQQTNHRRDVRNYPRYFLGTIITFETDDKKQIVDGQQRLTTLTLLLIHFHHLTCEDQDIADVSQMIFSRTYGEMSFNIDVRERKECMEALYETGEYDLANNWDVSVKNLVDRFSDIRELFPDTLKHGTLPFFVDWVIENVDLVEIESGTDNDAFTVFETMNDRGISLGPVAMLKGYLLANINNDREGSAHTKSIEANTAWRKRTAELVSLAPKEDQSFFKNWLRAKYAESARERHRGAKTRDFENIDKFHRWVRENSARLQLKDSYDFLEFFTQRFDRYSDHYLCLRRASLTPSEGLEEVYYNAYNNFTLQYMLALSPLRMDDDTETVQVKMQLVATFSDIYLARRMVNRKSIGRNTLQYAMFNLVKEIRDTSVDDLKTYLVNYLEQMDERISGITESSEGPFLLHGRNNNHTKYLLARITTYVEQESGMQSDFHSFTGGQGQPFEIEHIWADKFENHKDEFTSEEEFQRLRNHIGGLVLLPKGTNQSYGGMGYEEKVEHYVKENLLAASLHQKTYENNPNFTNFVQRSGLLFKPHPQFKKADLMERQELYRQICERIWNPERLNAI